MYTILIADDDKLMREICDQEIRREFHGKVKVYVAHTGRELIAIADEVRPDIAFVDIQMPGINGIDAIKEIQKKDQSIYFIIQSAYDSFAYARSAIELRVIDFLVKPVTRDKLIAAIYKAVHRVERARENRNFELEVKEKLETVIPIIENGFIYSVLFQDTDPQDVANYKQLLSIEDEYAMVMVIEFGMGNPIGAVVRAQGFLRDIREIVREFFSGVVGPIMANHIVVIIPKEETDITYENRVSLVEKGRKMIYRLNRRTGDKYRLGIGSTVFFSRVKDSYYDAMRALKYMNGSVAHIGDYNIVEKIEESYPYENEQRMFELLRQGDLNLLINETNAFFDWMVNNYGEHKMDVKLKVLEMTMNMEREAFYNGNMTYHFRDRKDYMQEVLDIDNYLSLKQWFLEKVYESGRHVVQNADEELGDMISKAKKYIDENYNKDVSLQDVSRHVNISPYHFSKVFREKTGETFIVYLTKLRINRAKELLLDKDMSIKEVCLSCGYSEPNYFSRLFKKWVGLTPTEFREKD